MADSQTSLSRVAQNGHVGVVKILLERNDINPSIPDKYDRMPLSLATQDGHGGVVWILLGRSNFDPNTADRYDLTPL